MRTAVLTNIDEFGGVLKGMGLGSGSRIYRDKELSGLCRSKARSNVPPPPNNLGRVRRGGRHPILTGSDE